jgi:multiple antibiotic resistance protein
MATIVPGDWMDDLSFALSTLSALFVVVDPIAAMPIFLTMTAHDTPLKRRAQAARAGWACGIILTVFALAGGVIFHVFGISLGSFKVAGGIMIGLTAIDMMRAQPSPMRTTTEEQSEGAAKIDVGVVPMGIPVLAGPGAIATVMVLMSQCEWRVVRVGSLMASIVVVAVATWLFLRASALAQILISQTTVRVLGRVMGLILAAIAVQFVVTGLHDLISTWSTPAS